MGLVGWIKGQREGDKLLMEHAMSLLLLILQAFMGQVNHWRAMPLVEKAGYALRNALTNGLLFSKVRKF